ncbi:MAG: D-glycero-beta-D-manno-heptose 1,7-bisphosphate 7-phosphatase [Gammaproteobacteria bacterium]|nr:D-glycero-beta-D-manno-heptose 1,7-bisphosphate 7-phosphatase [Gammaproteobacteria bacterium]
MSQISRSYKLIILDRDGVINKDSDDYIKSPAEWHAIYGSLAAIAKLNKMGCKVVVATNQSGIGRGLFSEDTLEQIHQKMQRELAVVGGSLDGIFYCPHHPDDNCECRKPKPKMLLHILHKYNMTPKETLVIGDSLRDIKAAKAIGCDSVLVKTGKGERTLAKYADELQDIPVMDTLAAVVLLLYYNQLYN